MGIHGNAVEVSLLFFVVSLQAWHDDDHHNLLTRGLRSRMGMMPQTGLLNINFAGLGNP